MYKEKYCVVNNKFTIKNLKNNLKRSEINILKESL